LPSELLLLDQSGDLGGGRLFVGCPSAKDEGKRLSDAMLFAVHPKIDPLDEHGENM
jgi:hypothetical protein